MKSSPSIENGRDEHGKQSASAAPGRALSWVGDHEEGEQQQRPRLRLL
jgi:hypothetical protein